MGSSVGLSATVSPVLPGVSTTLGLAYTLSSMMTLVGNSVTSSSMVPAGSSVTSFLALASSLSGLRVTSSGLGLIVVVD